MSKQHDIRKEIKEITDSERVLAAMKKTLINGLFIMAGTAAVGAAVKYGPDYINRETITSGLETGILAVDTTVEELPKGIARGLLKMAGKGMSAAADKVRPLEEIIDEMTVDERGYSEFNYPKAEEIPVGETMNIDLDDPIYMKLDRETSASDYYPPSEKPKRLYDFLDDDLSPAKKVKLTPAELEKMMVDPETPNYYLQNKRDSDFAGDFSRNLKRVRIR